MLNKALCQIELPRLGSPKQGKVRDLYNVEDSHLIVTTDRVSAFDVKMNQGIPHKGVVLNELSKFWMKMFEQIVPNHLLPGTDEFLRLNFPDQYQDLKGRCVLVKKVEPIKIECVVRGYLYGTAKTSYDTSQSVCGHTLRAGLMEAEKLDYVLFSPTTKAETGHDENIDFSRMTELLIDQFGTKLGRSLAPQLETITVKLYEEANKYATKRGLILADTKFEFGIDEFDRLIWIDEALTPDSSRYWSHLTYRPGGPQESFDKQYMRDYLQDLYNRGEWDKKAPPPDLPYEVIKTTSEKYLDAYLRLIGQPLLTA